MPAPKRPILIDTDTASDDAVALIMALRSNAVDVQAITVVAGNVPLEQAVRNALYTVELCRSNVSVFAGASKPLQRELQIADWFHGRDGLGDYGYAPSNSAAQTEHATDAMIRTIHQNPGIELITLGPLTNVALAIARDPTVVSKVSRCVVMGGAPCCEGNVTPAAEFNVWVDPEAARFVFRSGLAIELIGWQLCRGAAVINAHDIDHLNSLANPLADFAVRCNSTAMRALQKQTGEIGISLPDPIAMGVLLDPALSLRSSNHYVEIETKSPLTRGMTVVDILHVANDPRNHEVWRDALLSESRAQICWELDVARWKAMLFAALG